jgi:hypothetical protein
LHIASIVFILLGCITGFYAAYCWWKASSGSMDPEGCESGEMETALAEQQGAIISSLMDSARLNKRAALWTAISVGLSALGGVLGVLAGWIR